MKWIDVNEKLPEKDVNVLCAIRFADGDIGIVIRWRTIYNDVITDENGFAIYPLEKKVLAWMPLPVYEPNDVKP